MLRFNIPIACTGTTEAWSWEVAKYSKYLHDFLIKSTLKTIIVVMRCFLKNLKQYIGLKNIYYNEVKHNT